MLEDVEDIDTIAIGDANAEHTRVMEEIKFIVRTVAVIREEGIMKYVIRNVAYILEDVQGVKLIHII